MAFSAKSEYLYPKETQLVLNIHFFFNREFQKIGPNVLDNYSQKER